MNAELSKCKNMLKKDLLFDHDGMSLVELLIGIVLFGFLSAIVFAVYDPFRQGFTKQQVTADLVQKGRAALTYLDEEIRGAGLDPAESGNFKVIYARSDNFTYDFDTPDSSNVFDGERNLSTTSPERKTFRFQGSKLEQVDNLDMPGLIGVPPSESLLTEVDPSNSRFEYLDQNMQTIAMSGTPLSVPADKIPDIRAVRINLGLTAVAGRAGKISRTFNALVLCRNLQINALR